MKAVLYFVMTVYAMLGATCVFFSVQALSYIVKNRAVYEQFDKWVTTLFSMWILWDILVVMPTVAYYLYLKDKK